MMYLDLFAFAVRCNNQVLREHGNKVYLPFGSEYSLRLRNLNTRRAQVKVSIDGADVLAGGALVVDANSTLDLERFLNHTSQNQGNRFKFAQRTEQLEKHRGGPQVEDGLIRVEFDFERPRPIYKPLTYSQEERLGRRTSDYFRNAASIGSAAWSAKGSVKLKGASVSPEAYSAQVEEAGVTVPGSVSDQAFQTVAGFEVENRPSVLILHLVGGTPEQQVTKSVTVKSKIDCDSCGTRNSSRNRFCSHCGASLTVFA